MTDHFTFGSPSNIPQNDTGHNANREGLVTTRVRYDGNSIDKRKQNLNRKAVYPVPNPECLDILDSEPLFAEKSSMSTSVSGDTKVFSSFNGYGTDIEALYPNDEVQKVTAIMNNVRFVGFSVNSMSNKRALENPAVTVQEDGKISVKATRKLPAGAHTMIRPIMPSALSDSNRIVPNGTPPGKVYGELFPYDPKEISEAIRVNMNNFLKNESTYKRAMNTKLRSTDAWLTALRTTAKFNISCLVFGLELLLKTGVIQIANKSTEYPLFEPGATADEVTLALAKAMGILGEEYGNINKAKHMSPAQKRNWEDFTRSFLLKCHYDGEIGNLAFGYNNADGTIAGKKMSDGSIKIGTPEGAMLRHQLNIANATYSATSQLLVNLHEWNGPVIVKGAGPRETADGLL